MARLALYHADGSPVSEADIKGDPGDPAGDAGLLASRPAANAVIPGFVYYATDEDRAYISDGVSTWQIISGGASVLRGTLAARPSALVTPEDTLYVATDDTAGATIYQVVSGAWEKITPGVYDTGGRQLAYSVLSTPVPSSGSLTGTPADLLSITFDWGDRPVAVYYSFFTVIQKSTSAGGQNTLQLALVDTTGPTTLYLTQRGVNIPNLANAADRMQMTGSINLPTLAEGTTRTYKMTAAATLIPTNGSQSVFADVPLTTYGILRAVEH
jgi:hypothetical protein